MQVKRQKATLEKEMDQVTSESGFERTGSVITVIKRERAFAEVAKEEKSTGGGSYAEGAFHAQ